MPSPVAHRCRRCGLIAGGQGQRPRGFGPRAAGGLGPAVKDQHFNPAFMSQIEQARDLFTTHRISAIKARRHRPGEAQFGPLVHALDRICVQQVVAVIPKSDGETVKRSHVVYPSMR